MASAVLLREGTSCARGAASLGAIVGEATSTRVALDGSSVRGVAASGASLAKAVAIRVETGLARLATIRVGVDLLSRATSGARALASAGVFVDRAVMAKAISVRECSNTASHTVAGTVVLVTTGARGARGGTHVGGELSSRAGLADSIVVGILVDRAGNAGTLDTVGLRSRSASVALAGTSSRVLVGGTRVAAVTLTGEGTNGAIDANVATC